MLAKHNAGLGFWMPVSAALAGALGVAFLGGWRAGDPGKIEKLAGLVASCKITMGEAIRLAEEKAQGKAIMAELEHEKGAPVFAVKVFIPGAAPRIVEAEVAGVDGTILEVEDVTEEEAGAAPEKAAKGKKAGKKKQGAGKEEEEEAGEARQKAKKKEPLLPFTDSFRVDRKDLGPTGRNPFFILEPGYTLVLGSEKDGKVYRLSVTVLDETKVVDGVETRVVEERETVDGEVVELSRNWFAICRRTGGVFYFGEDAGGEWESGKGGARFGLMMPGLPLLGARYYQEIAPKVAMDRAEIVGLDETLDTPAGRFEGCLKVLETTPLEKTEREFKVYAPGVGLIQDGGLLLLEHGRK